MEKEIKSLKKNSNFYLHLNKVICLFCLSPCTKFQRQFSSSKLQIFEPPSPPQKKITSYGYQNIVPATSHKFSHTNWIFGTCPLKLCVSHRVYSAWGESLWPIENIIKSKTKSDSLCNKSPRATPKGHNPVPSPWTSTCVRTWIETFLSSPKRCVRFFPPTPTWLLYINSISGVWKEGTVTGL